MSEWIDCPKCGFNHENLTACPPPVISKSEYEAECLSEIPKEITAAARTISVWMKEQGHERWELFDLCSRNHVVELEAERERCRLLLVQQAHEEEVRAQLSHFLAQTQLRLDEWKDLAERMDGELCPPEKNCSCHINPPCSDCTRYGYMRDLKAEFAKLKGA